MNRVAALRDTGPVRLSSFRTGERLEMLSKRVYVLARTEGDIAWIRDGQGRRIGSPSNTDEFDRFGG